MSCPLEVVFLDVGGVLYGDGVYARALLAGLRELGSEVSDEEFEEAYRSCRSRQEGSFRRELTERFLGPGGDVAELQRRASRHWAYPAEALLPDVRGCLRALDGRYRLGLIANQRSSVREALERDGVAGYFEVWNISEELLLSKPDPRLFETALTRAGVAPERAAMVGDRLDYDVRPARRAGMRTVWVLRGEAPDRPTREQLAEADVAIRSLEELPAALEDLEAACGS